MFVRRPLVLIQRRHGRSFILAADTVPNAKAMTFSIDTLTLTVTIHNRLHNHKCQIDKVMLIRDQALRKQEPKKTDDSFSTQQLYKANCEAN
jgi:hypothetical protein